MAEESAADKKTRKKAAGNPPAGTAVAKKAGPAKKSEPGTPAPKTDKRVRVTLVRSVNGTRESHRATVRGLGLKRPRHTVELEDTPAVRGMINKVMYLLKVEA
jgi:large subunit ribosomal protein L30